MAQVLQDFFLTQSAFAEITNVSENLEELEFEIKLKDRTSISLSELGPNSSPLGSTVAVVNNVFESQLALAKSEIN